MSAGRFDACMVHSSGCFKTRQKTNWARLDADVSMVIVFYVEGVLLSRLKCMWI